MGTTKEVLKKLRGIDGPKILAIVNLFGSRENLDACLRGEKKITLEDVIEKFIDKNGRCIPAKDLKGRACDPNKSLKIEQLEFGGINEIFKRFTQFFPKETRFMSVEEFVDKIQILLDQLEGDPLLQNLLKGAWFPVVFPQMEIDDYGKSLEEIFMAVAEKSYQEQFPAREFKNHNKGELVNKVGIISGSRHEKLLAKMAEGPVVGIQFFPMQGFSINASREQMSLLPESLLLSGSIDILTAVSMYPDILGRDLNTTIAYLCSANYLQSSEHSLRMSANEDSLIFDNTHFLAYAFPGCSSGLLFLGKE